MPKMTLMVLDGFGVGAMDDCREVKPEDVNANTYEHIRQTVDLNIPVLYELGLGKIVDNVGQPNATYRKSNLVHPGGDTFMGYRRFWRFLLETGEPSPHFPAEVERIDRKVK
jgi:phosphopentomutase